jgi:hypothetical protein
VGGSAVLVPDSCLFPSFLGSLTPSLQPDPKAQLRERERERRRSLSSTEQRVRDLELRPTAEAEGEGEGEGEELSESEEERRSGQETEQSRPRALGLSGLLLLPLLEGMDGEGVLTMVRARLDLILGCAEKRP